MNYMSVCGVDGTGKSTIFSKLKESSLDNYQFVFSPQFHLNEGLTEETTRLSQCFDELGRCADADNDASMKALALFLSISLTGRVLNELKSEKTIVLERDPYLDVMAYSKFYVEQLKQAKNSFAIPQSPSNHKAKGIEQYINNLVVNYYGDSYDSSKHTIIKLIFDVFTGSSKEISDNLFKIVGVPYTKNIILLSIDEALLRDRLNKKSESSKPNGPNNKPNEIHENINTLLGFQSSYSTLSSELNISTVEIKASDNNFEEIKAQFL